MSADFERDGGLAAIGAAVAGLAYSIAFVCSTTTWPG
jgi:hypothetical protein